MRSSVVAFYKEGVAANLGLRCAYRLDFFPLKGGESASTFMLVVEIALGVVLGLVIYHHWKAVASILVNILILGGFVFGVYWLWEYHQDVFWGILEIIAALAAATFIARRYKSWVQRLGRTAGVIFRFGRRRKRETPAARDRVL